MNRYRASDVALETTTEPYSMVVTLHSDGPFHSISPEIASKHQAILFFDVEWGDNTRDLETLAWAANMLSTEACESEILSQIALREDLELRCADDDPDRECDQAEDCDGHQVNLFQILNIAAGTLDRMAKG